MKQPVKSSLLLLAGISIGIGLTIFVPAGYSIISGKGNSVDTSDAQFATESATFHNPAELSFGGSNSVQVSDPQAIADLDSSFARKTALFALLADAEKEKLLEVLKNSDEIVPVSRRIEIQSAVFQTLALTNPEIALRHALETPRLQQGPLLHSLFEEWSSANLEQALAQVESLQGSQRDTALRAILQSRDHLSEGERLQLAQQLGNEDLARTIIASERISNHDGSPAEIWEFIVNDGVDDWDQVESLVQVAELWSVEIGLDVLLQIHENYRENYRVYATLIQSLTEHDPQRALDFLMGVELQQRELVGRVVVNSWARTDPLAALNALQEFEPPRLRKSFVESLGYVWARNDPSSLVENIRLLGSAERIRPLEVALREIAQTSPEGALRQLEALADSVGDTSTFTRSIISVWSEKDPQAAVDWILSNYDLEDEQRSILLPDALGKLSLEEPHKAMGIALELPILENQFPPEWQIIWDMSWNGSLERTVEFLSRVRPDPRTESKNYAYGLVGNAYIRNDQPGDALKLAMQLPEAQREGYYNSIAWQWAYNNPLQVYEHLAELPDANAKSVFAIALVNAQKSKPALSDLQVNRVREYVKEDSD